MAFNGHSKCICISREYWTQGCMGWVQEQALCVQYLMMSCLLTIILGRVRDLRVLKLFLDEQPAAEVTRSMSRGWRPGVPRWIVWLAKVGGSLPGVRCPGARLPRCIVWFRYRSWQGTGIWERRGREVWRVRKADADVGGWATLVRVLDHQDSAQIGCRYGRRW